MVIGRLVGFRQRHDPVAMLKAAFLTACIYGCVQLIPQERQLAFAAWIFMEDPPFIRSHAQPWVLLLVVLLLSIGFAIDHKADIWRWLFFSSVPRTCKHHKGVVIWLHGVGDRGSGFAWLGKQIGLTNIKWVLPDANLRSISITNHKKGTFVRAWFDVSAMPITTSEPMPAAELEDAVAHVLNLIELQLADGFPPKHIILGGFSQGAAVAAWAAARCPHRLGGVVLWSGYLGLWPPLGEPSFPDVLHRSANGQHTTPFFYHHGDDDKKVLPECGAEFVNQLRSGHVALRTKTHNGLGHGCCKEQVDDLRAILSDLLHTGTANKDVKAE